MRLDLLDQIAKAKDLTHVFVLTYGADLMFIQAKLLPTLRKCGHPKLTIFADADRVQESYANLRDWLSGIGRRYRLIPVAMPGGFSFHAKAVLLVSEAKATLFVGSGNVGFAGWKENAEIWSRFDSDQDGGAALFWFHKFLGKIIEFTLLNEMLQEELAKAFEEKTRSWADETDGQNPLLGRFGTEPHLLYQMIELLGGISVKRLTICSPFFDQTGQMVKRLSDAIGNPPVRLLVQSGRSTLTREAAASLPDNINIQSVEPVKSEDHQASRFLHAKFYAFECERDVFLMFGSGNCSHAALGMTGGKGNCELMSTTTLPTHDFNELIRTELCILDSQPSLKDSQHIGPLEKNDSLIRVLAARYRGGELSVAWTTGDSIEITNCLVDGYKVDFISRGNATLVVRHPGYPQTVQLIGQDGDGQRLESLPVWIDNEYELSATAGQRQKAEQIAGNVTLDGWTAGGWLKILKLIHADLRVDPTARSIGITRQENRNDSDDEFTTEDIFSTNYTLPALPAHHGINGEYNRLTALRQLLLKTIGVASPVEEDDNFVEDQSTEDVSEDDDVSVDQQTGLCPEDKMLSTKRAESKASDIKRARRLAKKVFARLTAKEYLEVVPPGLLNRDLKIAGLLLTTGVAEGWLDSNDFVQFTCDLWARLFFSTGEDGSCVGWIEKKLMNADDPAVFCSDFADIELSAVLAMWSLTLPEDNQVNNVKRTVFHLSCFYLVARMPWLWIPKNLNIIAKELNNCLLSTGLLTETNGSWQLIRKKWELVVKRGFALKRLSDTLKGKSARYLKDLIKSNSIEQGEIVFQGGKLGFCILTESVSRGSKGSTEVYSLYTPSKATRICKEYLVPIKHLIDVHDVWDATLSEQDYAVLNELVLDLSPGLKQLIKAC